MRTRRWVAVVLLLIAAIGVTRPGDTQASVPDLGPGFAFGVAASGFQTEGHNRDSNWLRYGAQGKVGHPVGNAVDFYHRYPGDIALAAGLGVGIYRISIEWSRVEPARGHDDPRGWAFYDRVIRGIVAAGMRPMITLNHWVHPGWEVDAGGWNRPGMGADLVAFATRAVNRYAWADPLWITFNEPTEYVRRELMYGGLRPENAGRMADGIVGAHRAIYRHIHRVQPGAQVSSNLAYIPIAGVEQWLEGQFVRRMRGALDFIGVDQYYSFSLTDASVANAATGQFWKSSQAPEAIYYVLRYLAQQYPGMPIRVVENGLVTDPHGRRPDGYRRADHLRDTVYWLQRAKQGGVPVVSYNYWSLTDNYEWGDFDARFGLYGVDAQHDPNLIRHPTDGVAAYRAITAARGVPAGYRPTRSPVACSLVAVPDSCAHPAVVR
ncbi:family 1 glycosylhydrolase [Gordonia sp. ABSL1-1]|uniref:family 1 glycosylhydrolase n=1 Tax=Gordonia sp. ABSL1-1 TaxID=3053923 RepID=UPI0025746635|nr:family 1 glycosylhydrolase [Gordonia sp. ABSL1-1]MDL9938275.1 family 1 glycosylhydrolase [Gordonia sp. ABSL1-1]